MYLSLGPLYFEPPLRVLLLKGDNAAREVWKVHALVQEPGRSTDLTCMRTTYLTPVGQYHVRLLPCPAAESIRQNNVPTTPRNSIPHIAQHGALLVPTYT
jgi:hypothetical protein